MAKDNGLHAGFTGTPTTKSEGLKETARTAVANARNEANAVGNSAVDHPEATGMAVLTIAALAFGLGYLLGHSNGVQSRPRPRYWS